MLFINNMCMMCRQVHIALLAIVEWLKIIEWCFLNDKLVLKETEKQKKKKRGKKLGQSLRIDATYGVSE